MAKRKGGLRMKEGETILKRLLGKEGHDDVTKE